MKEAVLGYLIKKDEILLAYKKRGFGKGLYNGFGGKREKNESFEETLIREAKEELNITPLAFDKKAEILFFDLIENSFKKEFKVKVYLIYKWKGKPTESEELIPKWFNLNIIPYDKMWEDDKYWLPHVLSNKKLLANFYFKGLYNKNPLLLDHKIMFL